VFKHREVALPGRLADIDAAAELRVVGRRRFMVPPLVNNSSARVSSTRDFHDRASQIERRNAARLHTKSGAFAWPE